MVDIKPPIRNTLLSQLFRWNNISMHVFCQLKDMPSSVRRQTDRKRRSIILDNATGYAILYIMQKLRPSSKMIASEQGLGNYLGTGGYHMKLLKLVVIALFVVLGAGAAFAAHQEVSVDKGKALFNDPKLGTSGKSCNSCHVDGKGMEKAAAMKDLDAVVNSCITVNLKGEALDSNSDEMKSLVLYIQSFGVPKKPAEVKKAPVGC